jgi:hypothetical protein
MVNLAGHASQAWEEDGTDQPQAAPDIASQAERLQAAAQVVTEEGLKRPVWQWNVQHRPAQHQGSSTSEDQGSGSCTVRVSCMDARRLLAGAFLAEQTYDVIDIDR